MTPPTDEEVRTAALEVYTAEGVEIWMAAPNPMLDHRAPADLVANGEGDLVLDLIAAIGEGVVF